MPTGWSVRPPVRFFFGSLQCLHDPAAHASTLAPCRPIPKQDPGVPPESRPLAAEARRIAGPRAQRRLLLGTRPDAAERAPAPQDGEDPRDPRRVPVHGLLLDLPEGERVADPRERMTDRLFEYFRAQVNAPGP